MLHTLNNIKSAAEHFQSLLKLFSMFKIKTRYDQSIVYKHVTYAVGIIYTNVGKTIGCLLDNQTIENCITTFVKNMVFQYVGLSWIIQ